MVKKASFRRRLLEYVLVLSFVIIALPAAAEKEVGIAAIVGESAISTIDLNERIKLAMFAANLPKKSGFEEKILPQVLRTLVDEKIYMKEADNLGIAVTKDEIARVVADIEKRNGIQAGKFNDYLKSNSISQSSMMSQIKSQLTWNKIISRKIRPQITVTDKEIDEKIEHISKQSGVEEVNISEILLTVDAEGDDNKIKDVANKLSLQIRRDGDFGKIAKQFSKASSSENGGDLGWVRIGQFSDTIIRVIKNMRAGEISAPLKTPEGYTILKLNDRRALINSKQDESEVGLRRAFIPVAKDITESEKKKLQNKIQKKEAKVKTCNDFAGFAKEVNSNVDSQMVMTQIASLSPDISGIVRNLKVGEISKVTFLNDGFNVFMVCEKTEAAPALAMKNKIREGLLMRKLEIQANRYLRELRRGAFIEVRI